MGCEGKWKSKEARFPWELNATESERGGRQGWNWEQEGADVSGEGGGVSGESDRIMSGWASAEMVGGEEEVHSMRRGSGWGGSCRSVKEE